MKTSIYHLLSIRIYENDYEQGLWHAVVTWDGRMTGSLSGTIQEVSDWAREEIDMWRTGRS